MEMLTRLVSESLARHGFDRPLDYRRLQWSRWFRCESHHSLLCVPSKPGVFALAEEIMDLRPGKAEAEDRHSSNVEDLRVGNVEDLRVGNVEERRFSAASGAQGTAALAAVSSPAGSPKPEADSGRRMLAVTQFFEDDDMAFVLDRMLSRNHPMRGRLESGRYFLRFVEIQDQAQRRSICSALNQWIVSSSEKATGIGSHFASSLDVAPATELTNTSAGRAPIANAEATPQPAYPDHNPAKKLAPMEAVTAAKIQRIPLFPSGF
ncbi:MAG: hypothetical protein WA477_11705 [Candidatus Sulfotelmatobacter sp.]